MTLSNDKVTFPLNRAEVGDDAKALIDEDPRAYKDIGEVMANQADLVAIEHTLHQILNYKGT